MDLLIAIVVAVLLVALAAMLAPVVFGGRLGWTRWLIFRQGLLGRVVIFRQTSITRAVVSHLSAITNLNLPLVRALRTAGRSEPGCVGFVLRRIGSFVEQGLPLSTALKRADVGCLPLATSLIAAGEQSAQLPRALSVLESALADRINDDTPRAELGPRYWAYPLLLVFLTVLMLTFVMVLVIPKYQEIFIDFDTALPAITVNLVEFCQWFLEGSPPGFALLLLLLLFAAVFFVVMALALRPLDETMTDVILDAWGWIPGLTRPVQFGQGMSVAVRTLGLGLASGMSLPAAATAAGGVRVNRYLRRRWARFAKMTEGGTSASRAARDAGLGNVFVWACRTIERGNTDTQAILTHAADYHRAMAYRWWRALSRMAWPAVTCLLGCMVGYVVLALFLPLVALIDSVCGSIL